MNLYESTLKPIQYFVKVLRNSGDHSKSVVDFIVESFSNVFRICMHMQMSSFRAQDDKLSFPAELPPQCMEMMESLRSLELVPEDSGDLLEREGNKSKRACAANSSKERVQSGHLIREIALECLKLCSDASTIGYYCDEFVTLTLHVLTNSFEKSADSSENEQDGVGNNMSVNLSSFQMDSLKTSYKLCFQMSEMKLEGDSLSRLVKGVREVAVEHTKTDPFTRGYFKKLASQIQV
jgi:hypothetical protein